MPVRIHHASLFVSDLERSLGFYSDLLGLREVRRTHLDSLGHEYVFMSGGGEQDSDLVLARRDDGAGPPDDKRELFHLAYGLPDPAAFDALVATLRERGTPFHGPVEHDARADGSLQRRALYLQDPDGHVLEVTEDL